MNVSRIADSITEEIDTRPQAILGCYIQKFGGVDFDGFRGFCVQHSINITKDVFMELLANNEKYLFTEHNGRWLSILLEAVEL